MATAATLSESDKAFMIAAAEALDQHYQTTGDSYKALMGLNDRGTVEKARLFSMLAGETNGWNKNYARDELMNFWKTGGEGWDQGRIDGLLTTITDSYSKMSQVADDITGGSDAQKQSSSEMTKAAGTLKGLPAQMLAAIRNGMANVKIVLNGQSITDYVSQSQAQNLFGYVNPT